VLPSPETIEDCSNDNACHMVDAHPDAKADTEKQTTVTEQFSGY